MKFDFLLRRYRLAIALGCSLFGGCIHEPITEPTVVLSDKFSSIQKNIISKTCAVSGCHTGAEPKSVLSLDDSVSYRNLMKHGIENDVAKFLYSALIIPGKPDSSFLFKKIAGPPPTDQGEQMPQRLNPLTRAEITAIKSWILRGAPND